MKKIVSLFKRNHDTKLMSDEISPGAEWVVSGEGFATRKFDGTSCLIHAGEIFRRYFVKKGKSIPMDFRPAQEKPDEFTGHWPGWVSVSDTPDDKWHLEGFENLTNKVDGTYELCGPKVQNNPEGFEQHVLVKHGSEILYDCPRTFNELKNYLSDGSIEGIVWHHPDGRMVKIKGVDFGINRIHQLNQKNN